jgi:hypothetical protein
MRIKATSMRFWIVPKVASFSILMRVRGIAELRVQEHRTKRKDGKTSQNKMRNKAPIEKSK